MLMKVLVAPAVIAVVFLVVAAIRPSARTAHAG